MSEPELGSGASAGSLLADHARLKDLFSEVCDLPTRQQAAQRLAELGATAGECAQVLNLLAHDDGHTTHLSAPVSQMVASAAGGELQPGDRLDAWTLVRELGEGGMGRVFEAQRSDGLYEQRSAIKLLRGFSGDVALAQLAYERQLLASLNHPNIARLLDGGTTPVGNPYLVMEHVDGLRIDEHARQHRLSIDAVLDLFLMVCEAVAHAHQRLIVHCDIKPGNVLVDEQGRAKLLDFGIAQLQGRGGGSLQALTPRYASPEQRAGAPATSATDIYSLGRLLDELLAGLRERHQRLREQEMQAVVACATADSPSDRYPDVRALVGDLKRFRAHRPLTALHHLSPRWRYPAQKFVRRNWPWIGAGAAMLVLSVGFTLGMVRERNEANAARLQAQQEAAAKGQVTDFVVSMFRAADPGRLGHPDVKVSEVLARGRARIDQELAGQPLLQAELKFVLADVYNNIGQPKSSLALYEEALRLERGLAPQRLSRMTRLLVLQAKGLSEDGQSDAALRAAREARDLMQARPEAPALEVADVLSVLGWIESGANLFEDGRRNLQQAIALWTKELGPTDRKTAVARHNLGQLEMRAGHFVAAEHQLHQALLALESLKELPRSVLLTTREAWALSMAQLQRAADVLPIQQDTVSQRRQLHGDGSIWLVRSLVELSTVARAAAQPVQALAAADEALAIVRTHHPGSTLIVRIHAARAQALEDLGDPRAAEAHAELLSILVAAPAPSPSTRATIDFLHGRWLSRQGLVDGAEAPLLRAAVQRRGAYPAAHIERFEYELELATVRQRIAVRSGLPPVDVEPLQEGLRALDQAGLAQAPPRVRIAAARARALLANGAEADPARSAEWLSEAVKLSMPAHADHLRWRLDLVEALLSRGDASAAAHELAGCRGPLATQHRASPLRARAEALQARL